MTHTLTATTNLRSGHTTSSPTSASSSSSSSTTTSTSVIATKKRQWPHAGAVTRSRAALWRKYRTHRSPSMMTNKKMQYYHQQYHRSLDDKETFVNSPMGVEDMRYDEEDMEMEVEPDEEGMPMELVSDDETESEEMIMSLVQKLPEEMIECAMAFLDGNSLLTCALVCKTMLKLTYDRNVWKNICMQTWPTLRTQVLPQLPGAPDYDIIRLYGGCWRRCFIERHRKNQRAELHVNVPNFPAQSRRDNTTVGNGSVEKIVSETFSIGEHRFCIWIFPNGNPNEQQYAGKVLSAYLVLTDLARRPPSWLTCAVFSLSVVNHLDPSKRIEWHSCLVDNKFDSHLNNWGVHSLGSLINLTNPEKGFLLNDGTLTVTAKVRLMTITFRVVREQDLKNHHHSGLTDLSQVDAIELPFCCTLHDLLQKLKQTYNLDPEHVNVWCFNQPIVSGRALRPRKLLTQATVNKQQPMFGNLLCDGIDIDAYSFCHIYVESKTHDDLPLDAELDFGCSSLMLTDAGQNASPAGPIDNEGYLFVKVMNSCTNQLEYLGRIRFSPQLATSTIYESVARRLGCLSSDLAMFQEEIAPTIVSGPIPWCSDPISTHSFEYALHPADIVIFVHKTYEAQELFTTHMQNLLLSHYAVAERLIYNEFAVPTLDQVENLAEKLDIPKFRVRSAFRKCHEDGRNTLKYIMEGRHLGFICDSCGETDFKGPRYNCTMCSDYDLCHACNAQCHEVNHRYANVDGKWQRIYNFKDHSVTHAMREMLPVFYQYNRQLINHQEPKSAQHGYLHT